jgi:hypothetical protein
MFSGILRTFGFYFLEEDRKRVQLKVKDVIINTAREETAAEDKAINKTAKNKSTEIIFLRDNRNSFKDSINFINRITLKFLFRDLLAKRIKSNS